jgi:nucleoid-associated protein YgaU
MAEPKRESNLKIMAFDKPDAKVNTAQTSENTFIVPYNPNTFTISNKVEYKVPDPKGKGGEDPTFEKIPPMEFNVEFVIDGTGVSIDSSKDKEHNHVREEVKRFRKITGASINGEIHRPNYLALLWGTIHIDCVLTSLSIVYTLFEKDGSPLRAKVTCAFLERISSRKSNLETRLESPDLTKVYKIREGDTLPLIANEKYESPAYYLQLARVNKITNFRNLKPGHQIILPPMIESNE